MSERKACMLCFQYSDATDRAEMAEMLRSRCAELEKNCDELRAKLQAAERRAERAEAALIELRDWPRASMLEVRQIAREALDAKKGA